MQIQGITVTADSTLSAREVENLTLQQIQEWEHMGKELSSLDLQLEGDDIIVHAVEKSPIRRVRRITGYLSNIENFNDAKKSECHDRFVHVNN